MLKTFHYCNNCGKNGHAFHQCKYPITSIGVIVFRKMIDNTISIKNHNEEHKETQPQIQYLMIRRKDSLGFVDFIRGKYQLYNELYVKNIINGMTNAEKQRLLNDDFSTLWHSLWGENVGIQYRSEEVISRDKYNKLKEGITIGDISYSLQSLITNSKANIKYMKPLLASLSLIAKVNIDLVLNQNQSPLQMVELLTVKIVQILVILSQRLCHI
jgi:hypothetical protein